MRKLENYTPTRFMAADSTYNKQMADYAVNFIECLCHTKGTWAGKPFELIDFNEVIWDYDIEEIAQTLRANGITEFTISSTFSSLIETLAAFEKQGISMAGLTTVKARYTDWKTGEHALIPAIKMTVKEA